MQHSPIPVIDPTDAGFSSHPYPTYRRLRTQAPVCLVRLRAGKQVWLVSGFAEARAALSDHRLVKDLRRGPPGDQLLARAVINVDPPDHTRLRRLVVQAFSARWVQTVCPSIEKIAARLLAEIASFAYPLPMIVICCLLGIQEAGRAMFRFWVTSLLDGYSEPVRIGRIAIPGIHYCPGASLARAEARIAFAQLLARFPDLALAVPPEQLDWQSNLMMRGVRALPVRLRRR